MNPAAQWLICALLSLSAVGFAQRQPTSGTSNFVLDGNRVYVELGFVRPDGSLHRALAFVDMGSPQMTLTSSLFHELGIDNGKALVFRIGDLPVELPPAGIAGDGGEAYSLGGNLKVEATLAAGVLENYEVVLDYKARKLIFAAPGTLRSEGSPVPFRLDQKTGLIAVNAVIDAKTYAVTLDNGSAYTWFREEAAKPWLAVHPEWDRGKGAVGEANMMMSGKKVETAGVLMRIPEIRVGPLVLKNVGAMAAGKGTGFVPNQDLFDWYSSKNAAPVIGWIGGNVLKNFRLTLDYANRKIYWLRQADGNNDLNQVGLTLKSEGEEFFVAAIARQNGKPVMTGVEPGDKLVRIGSILTKGATWGTIYNALRGKPGELKTLVLERAGKRLSVRAPVTAF